MIAFKAFIHKKYLVTSNLSFLKGLEFDMNITFCMVLELVLHLRKNPLTVVKIFIT